MNDCEVRITTIQITSSSPSSFQNVVLSFQRDHIGNRKIINNKKRPSKICLQRHAFVITQTKNVTDSE